MIRLLICDDSAEARSLLRTVLAEEPEIEIVDEAADGGEAIAKAVALMPDVVLMDVSMPVVDGIAATQRLRELLPATRIVAFAGSDDGDVVKGMLEAGASAYCVKGAPLWELERAIAGAGEPLVRLAHALSRGLAGGVGQLVARELAELSGGVCAVTYLSSGEMGLSLAGIAGASADDLRAAPGVVQRAFDEVTAAWATAQELAELYRLGVPSGEALAVPLVVDAERLGAVLVAVPANIQFTVDAHLVSAVADLAAASIAQERRLALTYAEARRDGLTGLPNRRAFDERLTELLDKAGRHRRELALVLFDVDEFKLVNDERGHAAGDDVLRALSRGFLRLLRADEQIYRIGGDEFALLIEDSADAAARAADRLQRALSRQRRGGPLPALSAGVAALTDDVVTAEQLTGRADAALYAAKAAGRNRVSVHDGETVAEASMRVLASHHAHPSVLSPAPSEMGRRLRLLVVDDDEGLLTLLRTTFEIIDLEVAEADSAASASARIHASPPDVIVLDIGMPGVDGLTFCRGLKDDHATRDIPVVILSGRSGDAEAVAKEAGAEAFLRKPFSPLELLSIVEQVAGRLYEGPFRLMTEERPEEQLLLYAQDLRRLLEIERSQRLMLQMAYQETASALAAALASKDFGTGAHSKRVVRYARELTTALEPRLLDDPGLEYGFLLHDVGKIAIPDSILQKPSRLTSDERRVMRTHTVLGALMLAQVPLLQGPGLTVIRSHHERWDGSGYPDLLAGEEVPLGGRIFAVADTLDAMTSDRPYRAAVSWDQAASEIVEQAGMQFDPDVVEAFRGCEPKLRRVREELTVPTPAGIL